MTDLEKAEQQALFILFLESQIGTSGYRPLKDLNSDYHAAIPEHLLEPAFMIWVNKGWAKKYSAGTPLSVKMRKASFGDAYKMVLEHLGAKSLKVQSDTREIFSDQSPANDTPMKEGWKWFTFEQEEAADSTQDIGLDTLNTGSTVIPVPPRSIVKRQVDWNKSGAIAAWIAIPIAVIGIIILLMSIN